MRIDAGSVMPAIIASACDFGIPWDRASKVADDASLIARQYEGRSEKVICAKDGFEQRDKMMAANAALLMDFSRLCRRCKDFDRLPLPLNTSLDRPSASTLKLRV